jgi:hypothetical protein
MKRRLTDYVPDFLQMLASIPTQLPTFHAFWISSWQASQDGNNVKLIFR